MSQPSTTVTSTLNNSNQKAIAIWLLVCCATIFGMIILGGVTRLTGAGFNKPEQMVRLMSMTGG